MPQRFTVGGEQLSPVPVASSEISRQGREPGLIVPLVPDPEKSMFPAFRPLQQANNSIAILVHDLISSPSAVRSYHSEFQGSSPNGVTGNNTYRSADPSPSRQ